MNFINKLEKKFGRFAIPNIMRYVVICYAVGFVFQFIGRYGGPDIVSWLTLNPYLILHGQIWRIVSWVLVVPSYSYFVFAIIMIILYYQLGTALENIWGAFRFNLYMFGGMLFTIIGVFIVYVVGYIMGGESYAAVVSYAVGAFTSTYYINMGIFLAFALCFPDMRILLYFFIPVKMKWMAIIYAALIAYELISVGAWPYRVIIIMSMLNFLVFFLLMRNASHKTFGESMRQHKKKVDSQKKAAAPQGASKHKCAICGRTELTNPALEFRYCSKCNGNYEYCSEHLYTHQHVK